MHRLGVLGAMAPDGTGQRKDQRARKKLARNGRPSSGRQALEGRDTVKS